MKWGQVVAIVPLRAERISCFWRLWLNAGRRLTSFCHSPRRSLLKPVSGGRVETGFLDLKQFSIRPPPSTMWPKTATIVKILSTLFAMMYCLDLRQCGEGGWMKIQGYWCFGMANPERKEEPESWLKNGGKTLMNRSSLMPRKYWRPFRK